MDPRKAFDVLKQSEHKAFLERCRTDFPTFLSYVFSTDQKPYNVEPYNLAWWEHIEKWLPTHHAGIVSPPNLGKTTFLQAVTLWWIAHNPDERIAWVCAIEQNALDRVKAIEEYIEKSERLHEVFPHLRPPPGAGRDTQWNDHGFLLERNIIANEPTVMGLAMDGRVSGKHFSKIIFDDPVDSDDATSDRVRELHNYVFSYAWQDRKDPAPHGKMLLIIMYRWHDEDVVSRIMKDPDWRVLVQGLSDEVDCVEQPPKHILESGEFAAVEPCDRAKFPLPTHLLGNVEAYKSLQKKNPVDYGHRYQQKTASSFQRLFTEESLSLAFHWDLPAYSMLPNAKTAQKMAMYNHWPTIITSDFSGKTRRGSVILAVAREPGPQGRKWVVDIDVTQVGWGPPMLELMWQMHLRWKSCGLWTEDAGLQSAFVEWAEAILPGQATLLIKALAGSHRRNDPELGIPALASEFRAGEWVIPLGHIVHLRGTTAGTHDPWCRMVHELTNYPNTSDDVVMALWMAQRVLKNPQFRPVTVQEPSGLQRKLPGRIFTPQQQAGVRVINEGGSVMPTMMPSPAASVAHIFQRRYD